VLVAVLGAVAILAVLARLSIAGIGPFPASIDRVEAANGGLAITLTVTNQGAAGQTTCRVGLAGDQGVGPAAFVTTPRLEARETRTFTRVVAAFGSEPRDLVVSCRTP
jgi:hypothetical protein